MRAVSAIYFHWACDGAIERPATDVHFDCLTGISCYQYFMLREGESTGEVLMRPYSCWCPSCFNVVLRSRGLANSLTSATISTYLTALIPATLFIRGVIRAVGPRHVLKLAPQIRGLAIAGVRSRLQAYHRASGCLSRPSVITKTRYGSRRLEFSDFGCQSCCMKHTEGQRNIFGMRFNSGDFMVAVQWYERLPESGDGGAA